MAVVCPALALAIAGFPNLDPGRLIIAQAEEPQLVVLPPEPENVPPQASLDAWKVVVGEVTKAKAKLKVSLKLQKEIHDLLIGPAREQARDCGGNIDCLKEIGSALDAKLLIAGRVTKDEVSLVALDVATGQKIGSGKSPPNFAGGKVEAKAKGAAQALIASFGKRKPEAVAAAGPEKAADKGAEPKPPAEAARLEKHDARTAAVDKPKPEPEPVTPAIEAPAATEGEDLKGEPEARGAPPAQASVSSGEGAPRETSAAPPSDAASTAPPPALQSAPPPSENRPLAERPPPAVDVTEQWWFWVGIGVAVVAGGATAVALSGGLKGGPAIPSDQGTIQGRY